jgi:hypothetical protein
VDDGTVLLEGAILIAEGSGRANFIAGGGAAKELGRGGAARGAIITLLYSGPSSWISLCCPRSLLLLLLLLLFLLLMVFVMM